MTVKAKIKYNKEWCDVTNINIENNTCDFMFSDNKVKCYNYPLPKSSRDFIICIVR